MARGFSRLVFLGVTLVGCGNGSPSTGVAPAASSAAAPLGTLPKPPARPSSEPKKTAHGTWVAIPLEPEKVERDNNPKGQDPYKGPTGTLKGTIRIEGDPAPDTNAEIPKNCPDAATTYGKMFRVGPNKSVADVMVAVTNYDGYVPAREPIVKTTIHGCAVARRTLVATFGQRFDVQNTDKLESYMPYLNGAEIRAVMVAVPGGQPVKLYPNQPGHYLLQDQLGTPTIADVYVVKFSTHAVTDLEGHYEIPGIPVGKVRVDALLPAVDSTTGQSFEIKEGENTLDLTLTFDKKRNLPSAAGSASAAASASVAPAARDPKADPPRPQPR